jgi:ferredoxin-NADP reductase
MQFYNYVLSKKKRLAKDLFQLWLEPSDPTKLIPPPQAGQWVSVGFYKNSDEIGERRPYSLANQADHSTVQLLVKRRGEFSSALCATKPGTTLGVAGPFGQFIIKAEMRELVFLAGGIGIAPFVSMLRTATQTTDNLQPTTLFYSAKTKKDLILLPELRALAKVTGGIVVPTVTQQKPWFWNGEKGRVDIQMIKKYVTDSPSTYYFACGSKEFVADLEGQLKNSGVDEKRIVKEKFF